MASQNKNKETSHVLRSGGAVDRIQDMGFFSETQEDTNSRKDDGQEPVEFVSEEMDSPEANSLDGSLTNELVETQTGTVLKKFTSRPKMAYIQMAGRIPSGNFEFQDQASRIENERAFREYAAKTDVDVPDILGVEGGYVEFEKVDGVDMNTYLNQSTLDEASQAGRLAGDFLADIHDMGGAITDLRINNFMMQGKDDLAFVDGEYFSRNASDWERKMDMITMVSSAKQVDSEAYRAFRDGFEKEYGQDIDVYEDAISSLTAPGHAAVLERDYERVENSISNSKDDAVQYFEELF